MSLYCCFDLSNESLKQIKDCEIKLVEVTKLTLTFAFRTYIQISTFWLFFNSHKIFIVITFSSIRYRSCFKLTVIWR